MAHVDDSNRSRLSDMEHELVNPDSEDSQNSTNSSPVTAASLNHSSHLDNGSESRHRRSSSTSPSSLSDSSANHSDAENPTDSPAERCLPTNYRALQSQLQLRQQLMRKKLLNRSFGDVRSISRRRQFSLMEKSRRAFTLKAMELKRRLPFGADRRNRYAKSVRRGQSGARRLRLGRRPWRLHVLQQGGDSVDPGHITRVSYHSPPDAELALQYSQCARLITAETNADDAIYKNDCAALYCDRLKTVVGQRRCAPCSLYCSGVLVDDMVPDLQCVVCQCRYHAHCTGLPPVRADPVSTPPAIANFVCLVCYTTLYKSADNTSARLSDQARFHWPTHANYTVVDSPTAAAADSMANVIESPELISADTDPRLNQLKPTDSPVSLSADSHDQLMMHGVFSEADTEIVATVALPDEYSRDYSEGDFLGTPALFARSGQLLAGHSQSPAGFSPGSGHGRGLARGRGRGRPPITRGGWTPRPSRGAVTFKSSKKSRGGAGSMGSTAGGSTYLTAQSASAAASVAGGSSSQPVAPSKTSHNLTHTKSKQSHTPGPTKSKSTYISGSTKSKSAHTTILTKSKQLHASGAAKLSYNVTPANSCPYTNLQTNSRPSFTVAPGVKKPQLSATSAAPRPSFTTSPPKSRPPCTSNTPTSTAATADSSDVTSISKPAMPDRTGIAPVSSSASTGANAKKRSWVAP